MEKALLPESWNSWSIRKMLGEGAFGKVYLAEKRIGADVSASAIKVIRISPDEQNVLSLSLELGSSEAVRKYFEDIAMSYIQEIKTMIALKGHPNIVYIEDYAVEEDPDHTGWTIFIRMEYLTPFPEYIQTHSMNEADVIRLGMDLCSALSACEKSGILHRDIKPSNIFVSSATGQFKLGDFGIARRLERTGSIYSAKGTFPYMAPEVFHSRPSDHRADQYSLGLVLHHLLNRNREPFVDLNKQIVYIKDRETATTRRMSGEPIPPPADASPALSKVILKACDPNPGKRYPNAEAFRKALENVQPGIGHQNRIPSKKWLWIILCAVALAVLAALFLLLPRRNVPDQPPEPTGIITAGTANTEEPADADTPEPLSTPEPENTPESTNTSEPADSRVPEQADTPEPAVTASPVLTDVPEPTATVTPSPTDTPKPVITEVDISGMGIIPILEGKRLYYHPLTHSCVRVQIREISEKLMDAGCVFSPDELEAFKEGLKKQFFPEGNEKLSSGEEFTEGDRITLVYHPDDAFETLLNEKGYHLIYEDRAFIVKTAEDGSRLRFEPDTETGK